MQMFNQDYYQKYSGMGIMANLAIINSYLWGLQYLYSYSSEGKVKQNVKKNIERKFDENEQKFQYLDDLPEAIDDVIEENDFKMDIDDVKINPIYLSDGPINPDKKHKVVKEDEINYLRESQERLTFGSVH